MKKLITNQIKMGAINKFAVFEEFIVPYLKDSVGILFYKFYTKIVF